MDHRVRVDLHPLNSKLPKLGNPLESEQAAFRWLVAVMVGTGCVIFFALVVSKPAGVALALFLAGFVAFLAIRGIIGMLRPPDDDERGEPDA